VAGVLGGTLAFWVAGLYQDWLTGPHALLMGALVALAAPIGDLFESMIKRDLEVKDTGKLFGAHGGVLDRLDAVFFTVPVAYYAAVGLGYG
jgi:phosphatidate cytidylyltransferase